MRAGDTTPGKRHGRRSGSRQQLRRRMTADDGENRHEEERGGGLSEGFMDVKQLFGSSGESDDGAEGVDSESLSLSLSFTTVQ